MKYLLISLIMAVSCLGNLIVSGNTVTNVTGSATIGYLITQDNAVVNLYNLNNKWAVIALMSSGNSIVKLYTDNYVLFGNGGRYDTGYASGLWQNGVSFHIDLGNGFDLNCPDFDTKNHIQFMTVPEPATILILAIGMILKRAASRPTAHQGNKK